MTRQLTSRNAAEGDLLALYRTMTPNAQGVLVSYGKLIARLITAPPLDMKQVRRRAHSRQKGGPR